jgi:hypothetical protein
MAVISSSRETTAVKMDGAWWYLYSGSELEVFTEGGAKKLETFSP